ncbi:MAG: NAD(P)H-hydrate epimerase, partial [Anaerolineae bacterium]|nr:NAD(P)H-hydrate epimerase [Anaerolineae bacterium]
MDKSLFTTKDGLGVPSVDEDQMRRVDQIAVHDYGFSILQMMENAGRNLALTAVDMIGREPSTTCVLAGAGGNGGGGLSCARHLLNRGY